MLSNNEIKFIRSLQTKKYRQKYQAFTAEGTKILEELVKSQLEVIAIYCTQSWYEQNADRFRTMRFTVVDERTLRKISAMDTPQGVLAVVRLPAWRNVDFTRPCLVLLLDRIQDPGNLGTIIRMADWFGVHAVICSPGCCDAYNPKVVQASMGSVFRTITVVQDLQTWMHGNDQFAFYAANLEGRDLFSVQNPGGNVALIAGNEARGIDPAILAMENVRQITIPRYGEAESLNVAMAAGICLAWIRHQMP